jgi:hypothetical protein
MGTRSERLLELRPVTFAYKDDAQSKRHDGLLAEEVMTVYAELMTYAATGEVKTVRYQERAIAAWKAMSMSDECPARRSARGSARRARRW